MTSEPETNLELQLAECYVAQTGCNVFLTGKAGTGKTTFLKSLYDKTDKRLIVTAPTGVAAINAGGVTLHSFFQIPLGPFVPGDGAFGNRPQYRFSREKKEIIECLDLLVIDEISMVRADLLDAVDSVLCRYRRNNLPFGGVQLLMIGDLHQLPPVVKKEDWELLRQYYDSVYFFSSRALARAGFISIELKHIYRQTDDTFIHILNQLRNNQLDERSIAELNKRCVKDFVPEADEGYITLTTHNKSAESINNDRLQGLAGDVHRFKAEITGDFPRHNYPAPEELQLKKGAQVMLLRNDPAADKRYYNGKIGEVAVLTEDRIEVLSPEDTANITVEPVIWENIRYHLNKEAVIEMEVIGTFKQFPLKLAWATTIHKSQGLTFEKAIIDAKAAFVHGQTYVALSRCKTLDGVVLSSAVPQQGIEKDQTLAEFDARISEAPPSQAHLKEAQTSFQQGLLLDCFDFKSLKNGFYQLVRLLKEHTSTVTLTGTADLEQAAGQVNQELYDVGQKFRRQLQHLFLNSHLPESDPRVLERLNKASVWFQDKFEEIFGNSLAGFSFATDNILLKSKINDVLDHLNQEKTIRLEGIKALENGFSPSDLMRRVSLAGMAHASGNQQQKNIRPLGPSGSAIDHPDLVSELQTWRSQKAQDEKESKHQILRQDVLFRIAKSLPADRKDLRNIKGVGKKTVQKYGADIIAMVNRYRQKQGIAAVESDDTEIPIERSDGSTEKISETKMISYEMLQNGLTIEEIAEKRGLVKSTIEGHLCCFIEQGRLDIKQILPEERQAAIEKALNHSDHNALQAVKEELGHDYSYGEIKMVLALRRYQTK
jgi:hypothetical protein